MPLPSRLIYNDLAGDEIKHILVERFTALLDTVPYLQKHLTLPRVKMTLDIALDCWADQPTPERQSIKDNVEIANESERFELNDSLDASSYGKKPDQIREEHDLGIPTPVRGPIATEDQVEGKRLTLASGSIVDRTGMAPERKNATVIVQDFGVAGLAHGQMNRPSVEYGNRGNRDGGRVAPPSLPQE